jgi:hypothetical protein
MRDKNDTRTLDLFEEAPCPRKRKYVRQSPTNVKRPTVPKVSSSDIEQRVYEVICAFPRGCISGEVVKCIPEYVAQAITPRYAPLLKKGFIVKTGERRLGSSGRGQCVMRKAD